MIAASKAAGLTGPPKGVRVDESVSVSASEPSRVATTPEKDHSAEGASSEQLEDSDG